jgi:hypothetical protein
VCLSAAQLSMLLEGIDWVRRETDARQRVKVLYGEGLASHTGPESCGDVREDAFEALTGVRIGARLLPGHPSRTTEAQLRRVREDRTGARTEPADRARLADYGIVGASGCCKIR